MQHHQAPCHGREQQSCCCVLTFLQRAPAECGIGELLPLKTLDVCWCGTWRHPSWHKNWKKPTVLCVRGKNIPPKILRFEGCTKVMQKKCTPVPQRKCLNVWETDGLAWNKHGKHADFLFFFQMAPESRISPSFICLFPKNAAKGKKKYNNLSCSVSATKLNRFLFGPA